ncbi:Hypothetical predicted protein [Mytilus galloprovincialis]|uniref:Uncharacterized protein n=1 Tax=Mytilus galloprovincialis TaxID=29158 RepID=A0A8B6EME3_MYTGA|nr:Hypothetical predicted protein [Mytilus galloprovincialis]
MGLPTLLLCIALTVLPSIHGHTPEYFASIGQPIGIQGLPTSPMELPIPMSPMSQPMSPFRGPIPMSPMGQPISPFGQPMSPLGGPISPMSQPMSNQYGRIWCTCRRRCRYREWTVRYTCVFPFYPRYWNTCCKYLSNYQTSSMSRGSGMPTFPQYPPTYPGMGILPPK